MAKIKNRIQRHLHKHMRVRKKVSGTPERPRLCVYRSLNHIYAQLIDDVAGVTLAAASSQDRELRPQVGAGGNVSAAKQVGQAIAARAQARGIQAVVFDRGGYIFHGRVKALADGAREGGLKF